MAERRPSTGGDATATGGSGLLGREKNVAYEQGQIDRTAGKPETLERVGDCLRSVFSADNHDSLDGEALRMLLELSREPIPSREP